jgi:hypothetical protein
MKFRIYYALILLPLLVLIITTRSGHNPSVKIEHKTKAKVAVVKADLPELVLEDSAENKIQAEILSQNIKNQKCVGEEWCGFIPSKPLKMPHSTIFHWTKIKDYQTLTVAENMKLLKGQNRTKLAKAVNKFLTGPCPRNLSVAWLKKMDLGGEVPDQEKVYNFVKECEPEISHEEMYLRQALHYYGRGQLPSAQEAITRALTVISEEGARINYWAGEILQDKKYFSEVVHHYPYSWHAVLAAHKLNLDLFTQLESRPQYLLTESHHEIVQWVTLLLKFKKYGDLDTFLKWNINNPTIDMATWFYVNRLVVQYAPVNIGMNLTTRLANNKPDYVNLQVLDFSFPNQYQEIFHAVKGEVDFDPYLIMSLSKQESGFNPTARSPAKAWGLMQLLPATAKQVARPQKAGDLKDPHNNINLGVQYLSTLYQQLGTVEYALAAYNAGPSRVMEWLKYEPTQNNLLLFMDLIPFKETRSYVALILRNHYFYRHLNGSPEMKKVESTQFKDLSF